MFLFCSIVECKSESRAAATRPQDPVPSFAQANLDRPAMLPLPPGSGAPAAARCRGSKRGSGFVYGWLTNSLQSSASHDGRKRPHACTFRFHINDLTRGNRWRFSRRRDRITAISRQVRRFNCAPLLPLGHIFFAANQLVLRTTGREANFALTTAQSSASNAVGELA
jgi:hypothetical protein